MVQKLNPHPARGCIRSNFDKYIFFQIGWLKADTKAIQAIGKHVISNNDRISVSHDETRAKFRLHITNVTLEDAGPYMCQINSMPVKLQVSAKYYYYFVCFSSA